MTDTPEDPATLAALVPDAPLETPIALPPTDGHGEAALASAVGLKLATTMFLHHFAVGSWMVTLGSYVSANSGANGSGMFAAGFIGIAYGAGPLGGMVSPFFTGLLADHVFAAERIMAVLSLACAASLCVAVAATSQWVFYVAVLVYFLCYYPSFSLATSMALHHLRRPAQDFPVVRAVGTAGWVVGGLVVGWLWPFVMGESIEGTAIPMGIGAVAQLATAVFCLWLPHTPPVNKSSATAATPRIASRKHLTDLIRSPLFRALMILSVLAHIPSQFYYVYSNVFFNWVEMPYAAAKMTLGQCVEVACMVLLPAVLLRVSVKTAILIGLSAWLCRYVWLAIAASPQAPARDLLLYGAILLHGVAFTLVTISLQLEVDRCAGKHRRATAQGMFTVAVQGLGCLGGAQLAGAAGARWLPVEIQHATVAGWQTFWLLPAVGAAALIALTLVILPGESR
jgi:nucleoside transporter